MNYQLVEVINSALRNKLCSHEEHFAVMELLRQLAQGVENVTIARPRELVSAK